MLARVREEVSEERAKIKAASEAGLEELRAGIQARLDGLQQTENRSRERSASLRIDIDGLRHQMSILKNSYDTRSEEASHSKARYNELRLQLRQVEHDAELASESRDEESERRRRQHQSQVDQWLKMDEDTRQALSRQEVQISNRLDDLRSEHQEERARITDKIATLLGRKDAALRELRKQLADLQAKNQLMQESIDQRRDTKFGLGK